MKGQAPGKPLLVMVSHQASLGSEMKKDWQSACKAVISQVIPILLM